MIGRKKVFMTGLCALCYWVPDSGAARSGQRTGTSGNRAAGDGPWFRHVLVTQQQRCPQCCAARQAEHRFIVTQYLSCPRQHAGDGGGGFPVQPADRHRPFPGSLLYGKEGHFQRRVCRWEKLPVLGRLSDYAVQRLNGIGGIDHLADRRWLFEQRDQIIPVAIPATTDLRILVIPATLGG